MSNKKQKGKPPPFKVGDRVASNSFGMATIVEYVYSKEITLEFDCGGSVVTNAYSVKTGQFAPRGALKTNTQELWVAKAKEIHGDKYDYSGSVFTHYSKRVDIKCNSCGAVFSPIATNHVNKEKQGCPTCRKEEIVKSSRVPFSTFVEKAGEVHSHKYMYDEKFYEGTTKHITVICPLHGKYQCSASSHMAGNGECPVCKKDKTMRDRFKSLPENTGYKYLTYTQDGNVWIEHQSCGTVFSTPMSRVFSGVRFLCNNCAKQWVTFDVFLERAKKIHGEQYIYSDFKSMSEDMKATHVSCMNTFVLDPSAHIAGNYGKGVGCPHCATHGFSLSRDAHLYLLAGPKNYVKVGITHQGVEGRLRQISKSTRKIGWVFSPLVSWEMEGHKAKQMEDDILIWMSQRYDRSTELFDGSTETFIVTDTEAVLSKCWDVYNDTTN